MVSVFGFTCGSSSNLQQERVPSAMPSRNRRRGRTRADRCRVFRCWDSSRKGGPRHPTGEDRATQFHPNREAGQSRNGWRRRRLAEQRLVPLETRRHIAHSNDRPRAFHNITPVGLSLRFSGGAKCRPLHVVVGPHRSLSTNLFQILSPLGKSF